LDFKLLQNFDLWLDLTEV